MASYYQAPQLPSAFIWRRAHSLMGLWLVLFLIEHLLTNSQAALFFGEDGKGFITAVNALKELPYLQAIEILLLGIPFLIHGFWGVRYLFTSRFNNTPSDGSTPALPKNKLNQAYTWQRITSWILLFGIIAHVIHMRFIEYPDSAYRDYKKEYMIKVNADDGLYTLAKRLDFDLYSSQQIKELQEKFSLKPLLLKGETSSALVALQDYKAEQLWMDTLSQLDIKEHQLAVVSHSFGMSELIMIRETFKSPLMIALYTLLVLTACFHGFNGLWTFMISWGITLTFRSQQVMRKIAISLMLIVSLLGLSAIWGTYWFNLSH